MADVRAPMHLGFRASSRTARLPRPRGRPRSKSPRHQDNHDGPFEKLKGARRQCTCERQLRQHQPAPNQHLGRAARLPTMQHLFGVGRIPESDVLLTEFSSTCPGVPPTTSTRIVRGTRRRPPVEQPTNSSCQSPDQTAKIARPRIPRRCCPPDRYRRNAASSSRCSAVRRGGWPSSRARSSRRCR